MNDVVVSNDNDVDAIGRYVRYLDAVLFSCNIISSGASLDLFNGQPGLHLLINETKY